MSILLALAAIVTTGVTTAEAAAPADGFADLAAIDRAVTGFTGAGTATPGGAIAPIDRRLRLRACGAALAIAWRAQRHDTVVVRCPEAGGWTLYVPVNADGGASGEAPAIARGDAVAIAVTGDGFTVAQAGEALESGAVGAWIKVRPEGDRRAGNDASLRARVVRPGLVTLPLS